MKNWLLVLPLTGLAACDIQPLDLSLPIFGTSKAKTEITVTREQISLSGPRGYCVDPQSSTSDAVSAFVVFGNCAAITGKSNAPQPALNAIITTAVRLADPQLPTISASGTELSRFFGSKAGRAMLSRSSDPTSVEVKEHGPTKNGMFFLYVTDSSDGALQGIEDTNWRAYLDAENSVVTVSVLSPTANPLTRQEGLTLLKDFTASIHSDEASGKSVSKPTETTTRPIKRPAFHLSTGSQKTRKGILGRLFL